MTDKTKVFILGVGLVSVGAWCTGFSFNERGHVLFFWYFLSLASGVICTLLYDIILIEKGDL